MMVQTGVSAVVGQTGGGAAVESALDGLGDGDRLRQREVDRRVHVDAAERGFLDGRDAGLRHRDLHLDVRRSALKCAACARMASVSR